MKVEVPMEFINNLVNKYGCTQDEAIKAYMDAKSDSEEFFHKDIESKLASLTGKNGYTHKEITPKEIKQHLDKYVIGQDDYKKRLAIATGYHFKMVHRINMNGNDPKIKRFRKKNTIIAGPSGSGKTYCVEVLGDLLDIPTNIVDATDYTEAGYVGKNAEDMVRELVDFAPGETKLEKAGFITKFGGLIFIDEIDKKAKEGGLIGHDISREGFQRAVLKLIERKQISIDSPHSPASQMREMMDAQKGTRAAKKDENLINTENILFVIGGSFQRNVDNLESLVKKRVSMKSGRIKEDGSITVVGFTPKTEKTKPEKLRNYYKEANADDYIRFGLLPELVGRAPIRTYVNHLSKNDLVRIMTNTEDSILEQYKFEFSLFDIDIIFKDDAIDYVAQQAEKSKTGARALVSVWEDILTNFQFELPGSNFKELVIDAKLCKSPQDSLFKMLERSPFMDFIESFKNNTGITISFNKSAEKYIKNYADKENIQVTEAIRTLTKGIDALNYMNYDKEFVITEDILKDEKYFDKIYVNWHDNNIE
ncbi:MAG: AAA family ATPase [Nitrospinae bacterium]|nr:AAA family ATPase [Nitrospinota bacterium]